MRPARSFHHQSGHQCSLTEIRTYVSAVAKAAELAIDAGITNCVLTKVATEMNGSRGLIGRCLREAVKLAAFDGVSAVHLEPM
jgi:hypothetical protein